ncbi:TRAP transporter substrate-binding protein [Arthrobacter sp. SA17]
MRSAGFLALGILLSATGCAYEMEEDPTVLRLGTSDDGNSPAGELIEEFARQVESHSGGKLLIEPVWHAGGQELWDHDQAVARSVVSGELDMALVPSRTWDSEGVLTLRALSTPFLVTSSGVLKEAVKPELAEGMLAGLDDVGLKGLALIPEGLQLLFSFRSPILTPADTEGMVIRATRSTTAYKALAALGAVPEEVQELQFADQDDPGQVGAAESSFAYATQLRPARATAALPIATGNVVLSSRANTLVINMKALDELREEDRQVLSAAAAAARNRASDLLPALSEEARNYCQNGGTVVTASDEQVDAFRRAVAPVYAEMEQDHQTKDLIARLSDLAASAPVEAAVEPCG